MTIFTLGPKVGSYRFSYSDESGFTLPVRSHHVADLDNDGVEEIIFAGIETQPNTPETYTPSLLNVFGWKDGEFRGRTAQFLPGNIHRVKGGADLAFGDFNGDGHLDFYIGGNADMSYEMPAYQYLGRGSHFDQTNLGITLWEHGLEVFDINGDGYDDVIPFGWSDKARPLVGGPSGLRRLAGGYFPGSGGVVGDFLGDGSLTIIVVDHASGTQDTRLLSLKVNTQGNTFQSEVLAVLPLPILESFNFQTDNYDKSHDIRAKAIDFNQDDLLDVLVFSRGGFNGKTWVEKSAIQFLRNDGGGKFTDVTATVLFNYNHDSYVGYKPIIRDFNLDGWLDIFQSDSSWLGPHRSSSFVFSNRDGTFTDSDRDVFSNLISPNGGMSSILKGPGGQNFLLTESIFQGGAAEIELFPIYFPQREQSELLPGSAGADAIFGLGGNDTITGNGGNDTVDGGLGTDILQLRGSRSQYHLQEITAGVWSITDQQIGRDGKDSITAVERIKFADGAIALDVSGLPSQAYRIYKAAFDRIPDRSGLGYWISQLDNGLDLVNVAARFIDSPEFRQLYGVGTSNAAFITKVYNNVLDRNPDEAGLAWWVREMQTNSSKTWQKVLADFSESVENQANVSSLIAAGISYEPWV